jgi:hypothetical protein
MLEKFAIIKQAVNVAVQKGCYNLGDIETILVSLNELQVYLQSKPTQENLPTTNEGTDK